MPIETFPIGPLETNCHIVISGSDAVAVDPGGDLNSGLGEVLALLKEQNLTGHPVHAFPLRSPVWRGGPA